MVEGANSAEHIEACEDMRSITADIFTLHENGMDKEVPIILAQGNTLVLKIVDSVYSQPNFASPEEAAQSQRQIIEATVAECLRMPD